MEKLPSVLAVLFVAFCMGLLLIPLKLLIYLSAR